MMTRWSPTTRPAPSSSSFGRPLGTHGCEVLLFVVMAARALLKRRPVDGLALCLGVAIFLAGASNLAFWQALATHMPPASLDHLTFLLATSVILVALLFLLCQLFAWPFVLRPFLIGGLLIAAVCSYFMSAYGVVIDLEMIRNVAETDFREARDLLTAGLVFHVLLLGVLPALVVARFEIRFASVRREAMRRGAASIVALALTGALIAGHFKEFSLLGRQHKELRLLLNPTSPVHAAYRYLRGLDRQPKQIAIIAADASRSMEAAGRRPLLAVVVVGETARAASFSLNGYARDTNPLLASLPVINFTDVEACGTSTAVSVPCMFSPYGRAGYSDRKAKSHESLLDVLQRLGVAVLWRDNNAGCKGACDRVPRQTERDLAHPRICEGNDCFDEVLLEGLPAFADAMEGDTLVVLHMNGSHGPAYFQRSPEAFKRFKPECASTDVTSCDRQSIVNAYDNTIVYTDFVLSRLIELLEVQAERFDVAMLYVSDHGESLGERGLYLHGLPFWMAPEEQTRVPLLLWLSADFERGQNVSRACLDARRHEPLSHDNLFHSVLGLFAIDTALYEPALDLFRACRTAGVSLARTR